MFRVRSVHILKALWLAVLLAVSAGALAGCKGSAVPGLTAPDFALSTPAPLPGPGEAYPPGAGS